VNAISSVKERMRRGRTPRNRCRERLRSACAERRFSKERKMRQALRARGCGGATGEVARNALPKNLAERSFFALPQLSEGCCVALIARFVLRPAGHLQPATRICARVADSQQITQLVSNSSASSEVNGNLARLASDALIFEPFVPNTSASLLASLRCAVGLVFVFDANRFRHFKPSRNRSSDRNRSTEPRSRRRTATTRPSNLGRHLHLYFLLPDRYTTPSVTRH